MANITLDRKTVGLATLNEVADMLGTDAQLLVYHIKKGHIPRAKTTINHLPRKYYTTEEVRKILSFFKDKK